MTNPVTEQIKWSQQYVTISVLDTTVNNEVWNQVWWTVRRQPEDTTWRIKTALWGAP